MRLASAAVATADGAAAGTGRLAAPRRIATVAALGAALAAGLLAAVPFAPSPPSGAPAAAAPAAPVALPRSAVAAWSGVPVAARLAVARALGAADSSYHPREAGGAWLAGNPGQGMAVRFDRTGAGVRLPGGTATLRLAGPAAAPQVRANRVSFRRGAVTEWYANTPLGLEQGFRIARRPGGAGADRVTLPVTFGGTLRPAPAGPDAVALLDAQGRRVLRYDDLTASDARGRALPAHLLLRGRRATIAVDVRHAAFPVVVDPLVQRAELAASDGFANEHMGAVALSGDTLVVGAPSAKLGTNTQGAVYVFTRPAGGWADAQQTAKLIASDARSGPYYGDLLGSSVAISGDTIVAGAPYAPGGGPLNAGRVYVFVKPAGGWQNSVQNAELVATDAVENAKLGSAVAIDGDTVVASSPGDYQHPGELYVFTRPAGGWTSGQEAARLTATGLNGDEGLGDSIAISGSTVVAGAPFLDAGTTEAGGAAYVWTKAAGAAWIDSQPATRLVASAPVTQETLGAAVAIDGGTVVAGASHRESQGGPRPSGRAFVFLAPSGGWSTGTQTQSAVLTASAPAFNDGLGAAVGVSGSRVAVGVPSGAEGGTTYIYDRPAGGWTDATESAKVAGAAGGGGQGSSVALAGGTLAVGAPGATVAGNAGQGAGLVFEEGAAGTTTTTATTTTTTGTTTGTTTDTTTTGTTTTAGSPPPTTTTTAGETPPAVAPPNTSTFAVPAGQIVNTFVAPPSGVPEPTASDIIAGLFGVVPGSGATVNVGEFTFVAYCHRPAGQCAAGTSFSQQLGNSPSSTRAHIRAAKVKRPPVLAKGAFVIPAGKHKRVVVKLTAAGRRLLARKHRIRGSLTITLKGDDGKRTSASRKLTIVQKRHAKH